MSDAQTHQLTDFYQREWWTRGRSRDDVRQMLAQSTYVYGIAERRTGKLVGFARVLSDGIFKALIFDVIVEPAHRGEQLGDRLMSRILGDERLERVKHFELYCLPELARFYERFGFTADVSGVALMRRAHGS